MAPIKCEWCGQLLFGTYHTGKDKDGNEHGYFCSPKCVKQATKAGFRGTPFMGCGAILVLFLIGCVGAFFLSRNSDRMQNERKATEAEAVKHFSITSDSTGVRFEKWQFREVKVKVNRGDTEKRPLTIVVSPSDGVTIIEPATGMVLIGPEEQRKDVLIKIGSKGLAVIGHVEVKIRERSESVKFSVTVDPGKWD